jgi:hypothetical protein
MKLNRCRLEFKAADCWIGVYWAWSKQSNLLQQVIHDQLDIWVCLMPTVPIHFVFVRRTS